MKQKTAYGQFYSTRVDYLLRGHKPPKETDIVVEPFVGQGDLLKWQLLRTSKYECFDIYPKIEKCTKQNTLTHPPVYKDKFVLTNPPYLAMNHSERKTIYQKWSEDDLYKCFIRSILQENNMPKSGIIIVPANFWCSIRNGDCQLRADFLKYYNVNRVNIYEESVFEDTSYMVCSFSFTKRAHVATTAESFVIKFIMYPEKKPILVDVHKKHNWRIGGEIYYLPQTLKFNVGRSNTPNTRLHILAIDSGTQMGRIRMVYDPDVIYTDLSSRSFATLNIHPKVSIATQKRIETVFNEYLEKQRKKYHSMFLTNYRESKEYARKRISFELVYQIVNCILRERMTR